MSYTDGVYDSLEDIEELDKIKNENDRIEWYRDQSAGAVTNKLLNNYIDVISDVKNLANARASIDVITEKIQDELLPYLTDAVVDYREGFYELSPYFQARRKMEFSTGKDGIAPFALNITNLALTQYTHLTMDYGENEFGFGALDEILGEDGLRISDWLSAMVNAHVDVAKDPYIFSINVNRATYNYTNFLLRAGKGISTFTFLAQPILRELSDRINNSGGIYGQNIDGRQIKSNVYVGKKEMIIRELKAKAVEKLDAAYNSNKNSLSKEERSKWSRKIQNLKTRQNVNWKEIFDSEQAIKAIKESGDAKSIHSAYFQLLALESFIKITPYADEISKLVKVSQIDTKKFGNNIASHLNFKNKYELFKFGDHGVKWVINDGTSLEVQKSKGDSYALRKYFNSLFLDRKFYNAVRYTREILSYQTYTATPIFESLFNAICAQIQGEVLYKQEIYQDGKLVSIPKRGYKEIGNDDVVQSISTALDNIIRYRMLANAGVREYNAISNNSRESLNIEDHTGPIDFTMGGDTNAVRDKIRDLLFGNEESKDEYGKNPLFSNVAKFIHFIKTHPEHEYAEGLIEDGKMSNEFLDFLNPQPANDKFPIGRLLLKQSQMNLGFDQKMILISAFDKLLRHPSEKVRRMARDIAFYAYYSTYDTNTVNSFFDLVPYYYRKQYDRALSFGLKGGHDKLTQMLQAMNEQSIFSNNDGQYTMKTLGDQIMDFLSRNYWYDDNIVPIFYEHSDSNITASMPEIKVNSAKTKNKNRFSGVIFTAHANSPYFKIVKNKETVLYKRIGTVKRSNDESADVEVKGKSKKNNKKNNKKSLRPVQVYVAVPKLGMHSGSNHQYEFMYGSLEESVFTFENALPKAFSPENTLNVIDKVISKFQEENIKTDFVKDAELNMTKESMYYESNNSKVSALYNSDNSIRFLTVKNGDLYAQQRANIILDIDYDKHSENDKTLKINSDEDVESLIKKISDKIKYKNPTIYISGVADNFAVSEKQIEEYTNRQIEKYKTRLYSDENIQEEDIESMIEDYKSANSESFKNAARQNAINQFMFDLINGLVITNKGDLEINTIYIDGNNEIAVASGNTVMLLQNELTSRQGYVILNDYYSKSKNVNELLEIENAFDSVDEDIIYGQNEIAEQDASIEMIEGVTNIQEELDKASEKSTKEAKKQTSFDPDIMPLDTSYSISMDDIKEQLGSNIIAESGKNNKKSDSELIDLDQNDSLGIDYNEKPADISGLLNIKC